MKNAILLLIFLSAKTADLPAQALGQILSPRPAQPVKSGELLIAFRLDAQQAFAPASLKISLDKSDISQLLKIRGSMVSALMLSPLKNGEHVIRLEATNSKKETRDTTWTFTVAETSQNAEHSKPKTHPDSYRDPKLQLDLETRSRLTDLQGPGSHLRQEPPSLNELNLRGAVKISENLELPFQAFVTDQQNPALQWRNFFMAGIRGKRAGVLLGDVLPDFQPNVLNGARLRGGEAYLQGKKVRLSVAYGLTNKGLDGSVQVYDPQQGFPPPNLDPVSGTFVVPGTFERLAASISLRFQSSNALRKTTFTVFHANDRPGSIANGGPPAENIVGGLQYEGATRNQKFKYRAGLAASFTTLDTRLGAVSNEDLDSLFGHKFIVDPAWLEKMGLFTVNATTTPLTTAGLPFLAAATDLRWNTRRQNLSVRYERFGSEYRSFGVPFLVNDRQIVALSDQLFFFEKKAMLELQYQNWLNNLAHQKEITQKTHVFGARTRIRLRDNWPQLTAAYRLFDRRGVATATGGRGYERSNSNTSIGIFYSAPDFPVRAAGKIHSSLSLNVSRMSRSSQESPQTDSRTDALNVAANVGFAFGLEMSGEYSFLVSSSDDSDFNRQNTYGFRVGYRARQNRSNVSVGLARFRTEETFFLPESVRESFDVRAELLLRKWVSLVAQAGSSRYTEAAEESRNFREIWGEAGLRVRI